MKRTYVVTQKDIDQAVDWDYSNNPIARAIKRVIHRQVYAYTDVIEYLTSSGNSRIVNTPKKVAAFIDRFHDGKKVKPFSFEI